MSRLKSILLASPEYLLIIAVLFYWFSSAVVLNPVAIVLSLVLILQIVFRNRITGLLIPSLLIMLSLYMLLTLFSEFNEFPTFSADARELLFVGLALFLGTIGLSVTMVYKYAVVRAS